MGKVFNAQELWANKQKQKLTSSKIVKFNVRNENENGEVEEKVIELKLNSVTMEDKEIKEWVDNHPAPEAPTKIAYWSKKEKRFIKDRELPKFNRNDLEIKTYVDENDKKYKKAINEYQKETFKIMIYRSLELPEASDEEINQFFEMFTTAQIMWLGEEIEKLGLLKAD